MKSVAISPTKTGFGPLLFCGKLKEGIEKIRGLGFDAVELSIQNPEKLNIPELLNFLKESNLTVSTIATGQSYYNEGLSFCNSDPNIRRKTIHRVRKIIDLANTLKARVIIGGIRGKLKDSTQVKKAIYAIKECVEYAEKKKTILLLEPINRYETNFVNTVGEAVELIKEIKTKNLKVLPDTFHMNIEEVSIAETLLRNRDYLGGLHLADSNRLAPGWGHINFEKIKKSLKRIKYAGFLCAEILPKPDDFSAAKQAIKFLKEIEKEGENEKI